MRLSFWYLLKYPVKQKVVPWSTFSRRQTKMLCPGVFFQVANKMSSPGVLFPGCKTKVVPRICFSRLFKTNRPEKFFRSRLLKTSCPEELFFLAPEQQIIPWTLPTQFNTSEELPTIILFRRITQKNSSSQLSACSLTLPAACSSKTDPGVLFEFFRSSFRSSSGFRISSRVLFEFFWNSFGTADFVSSSFWIMWESFGIVWEFFS